ncbi:MAG: heparinase, partial [Pedobacter sp.]
VIQLLTWAFRLAELNGEAFQDVVYLRAKKSVSFLLNCMENESGWLPNYGNNDGALFFKLNDQHYRDYRPQLEGLSSLLNMKWVHQEFEDALWYGLKSEVQRVGNELKVGSSKYGIGGFYTFRNENSLTFLRCGNHRDRPAQADNLHLDIWHEGKNILHDGGTYKYNSNQDDLKYFMGTQSHNTVMLGDYDQMEKGSRFIWYHWTQCVGVKLSEDNDSYMFEGTIKAFQHIDKAILHTRQVKISKNTARWEVTDHIVNKPDNLPLKQLWHTSFLEQLNFSATLPSGEAILPAIQTGYYSSFYGVKVESTELVFSTDNNSITTVITVK